MKISVTDWQILIDALYGSITVQDGGQIFRYTPRTRKALLERLVQQGDKVFLNVDMKRGTP